MVSIAAMNWAWQLKLKPTLKFVLMALADAADDDGYCWPSVPTLARKTCMDERSVQRLLKKLKDNGLVQVQARFRNDGSPTSNGYRLPIGSDKLPPPHPATGQGVVTPAPLPGGSDDTLTTTDSFIESKPLQPEAVQTTGGSCELVLPKQLAPLEATSAKRLISKLPAETAQALLDELAARLNAQTVRGSPLSYLRALVGRAEAGTFSPEAGIRVSLAREREKELAALKKSSTNPQTQPPDIPKHLLAIRKALNMKSNPSNQEA